MQNIMSWIVGKLLGIGQLGWLASVDKDKLTTYLGLGEALLKGATGYLMASAWDPTLPAAWIGLAWAIMASYKSWATNKA